MKTIDRYILSEWLQILALTLAATLGLLVLESMYGTFGDFLDYGAGAGEIFRYYLVLIPSLLPIVLPLSLLLSLLYALGQMHRNNEFTALRACGCSLLRLTWSIWLAGALFSALLLILNARIVPWSVEEARNLELTMEFRYEAEARIDDEIGIVYNLAYDNRRANRIWFMNRFSEYTMRGFGVTVSVLDEERNEIGRWMARQAHYDDVEEHWVFLEGRKLTFDPETGDLVRSLPFDVHRAFEMGEPPRIMILLGKRPKDLSLFELKAILDTVPLGENPHIAAYAVRYHSILAGTFSCLIVVGLAVPFAVSGVRVSPMVGVSKSIGLFVLYFVFETTSRHMGDRQLLEPIVAAWVPNLVMATFAFLLFKRTA